MALERDPRRSTAPPGLGRNPGTSGFTAGSPAEASDLRLLIGYNEIKSEVVLDMEF